MIIVIKIIIINLFLLHEKKSLPLLALSLLTFAILETMLQLHNGASILLLALKLLFAKLFLLFELLGGSSVH
jgi:hypothetical protein